LLNKNLGESKTGYIQYLFQAKDFDKDCQEIAKLVRKDGSKAQLTINVKKGHCKPLTCKEGLIQNLDVKNCQCEALKAPLGDLIDSSKLKGGFNFYFKKDTEFTLREWALTTGGYEWSIAADHTWAKCLTPVGEAFDDGRYRQVSYKATVPDCKDVLVRVQAVAAGSTEKPAEQIWSFSVWPDR